MSFKPDWVLMRSTIGSLALLPSARPECPFHPKNARITHSSSTNGPSRWTFDRQAPPASERCLAGRIQSPTPWAGPVSLPRAHARRSWLPVLLFCATWLFVLPVRDDQEPPRLSSCRPLPLGSAATGTPTSHMNISLTICSS